MTVVGGSTDHLIVDRAGNAQGNMVLEVQTLAGVPVTDVTAPSGWTGQAFPAGQARADSNGYFTFVVPDGTGPVQVRTAARTVGSQTFAAGQWLTPSGQIVPDSGVEQALAGKLDTGVASATFARTENTGVNAPASTGVTATDTANLQALLDGGASVIALRPFGGYSVSSLTLPARDVTLVGRGSSIIPTNDPVLVKNGTHRVTLIGVQVTPVSEANDPTDALTGFPASFLGQLLGRNTRASDRGVFDLANFAGQGVSSAIPGFTFHNYTDSVGVQMDNVGDGVGLVLKRAQNLLRRADKGAGYVGQGIFLGFDVHDDAAGFARRLLYVDKDGRFVWTGATPTAGAGGRARFLANKADDGTYAFSFELTNQHANVAAFGDAMELRSDVGLTRAVWRSMTGMTNGMMLDTVNGPLTLSAKGGTESVRLASPLRFNVAASHTTTATAGSATLPGNPLGFVTVQNQAGVSVKIPYYAV